MDSNYDYDKPKRRINGALTGSFIGQQVILLGQCLSSESRQIKLKCTDGHVILVQLINPLSQSIPPNTYLDIEGIVETRNKLKAFKYHVFENNVSSEFDAQLYNEMIAQMMSHGEANTFFITNAAAHSTVKDSTTFAM